MLKRAVAKADTPAVVSPYWLLRHVHGSHEIDRGAPMGGRYLGPRDPGSPSRATNPSSLQESRQARCQSDRDSRCRDVGSDSQRRC